MPSQSTKFRTLRETAGFLGKDIRTLQRWISEGCPGRLRGWYDGEAIQQWGQENKGDPRGPNGGTEDGEGVGLRLKRAQAREREARAELAELQLKIERGELVNKDEIKEWDLARIAVVKRGLLSMPRSIARSLIGLSDREIEHALMRRARDLLERFSQA